MRFIFSLAAVLLLSGCAGTAPDPKTGLEFPTVRYSQIRTNETGFSDPSTWTNRSPIWR